MTRDEIRRTALAALGDIAPEADLDAIDPGRDLRDQLDLDSVDFLRFVIALGAQLDVQVPELDYPKLLTIDGAVAYLAARAEG